MPHPHDGEIVRVSPSTLTGRGHAPVPYTAADHEVDDRTRQMLADSVPENTRRSYSVAWKSFTEWCDAQPQPRVPLPATGATLTEYVRTLIEVGARPNTISSRIGAIRTAHTTAGHEGQPPVKAALQLLRGYKRERAQAGLGDDEARPFTRADLVALVGTLDLTTFVGHRDRLLLVLGFALMARRSELSGLHLGDVVEVAEGLEITVRTSKADKESEGRDVAVPPSSLPVICPVVAFRDYRTRLVDLVKDPAGLAPTAPLIRSVTKHGTPRVNAIPPRSIWTVVERAVARAGLPNADEYSPHSLRAGGLTASLQAGVPTGIAARHGGWSPTSPVVNTYARAANKWQDNAMRGVL